MQQFSIKVTKKMNINKNVQGHLFALTANVMWGLMAPIGKFALQEFSALSVTTFRMVGAAAAFWILSMFCKQEHVNHKDMLKIFFDCSRHLSERTGYEQESIRYLCRSNGSIDTYLRQSDFRRCQ